MRQSRFTEAQIIGMIKEQEAGMSEASVVATKNEAPYTDATQWQNYLAQKAIPLQRSVKLPFKINQLSSTRWKNYVTPDT